MQIDVWNAESAVSGLAPAQLAQLRNLISYRDRELPPRAVMTLIRDWLARQRSMPEALAWARFDVEMAGQVAQLGWELTRPQFAAVARLPPHWDGWRTVISAKGAFPTGLLNHVIRALTLRMGLPAPQICDHREVPALWTPTVAGVEPPLAPVQHEALAAWEAAGGRGVIDLPPRTGKTRIAIAAVYRLQQPTLMVVPTRGLVTQTVDAFRAFFPEAEVVGVTGGQPNERTARAMHRALVWVCTPPTAAGGRAGDPDTQAPGIAGIRSRRFVIFDEFHHAAAATMQRINYAAANGYYRLGLTGTNYRADGADMLMRGVIGSTVYSRSVADMIAAGRLVPARVAMLQLPNTAALGASERLYSAGISANEARNQILADAARTLVEAGRRVLVLTKEIEHSKILAQLIGPLAVQVDASGPDEVSKALRALAAGTVRAVVGTSVIGEGVDVPNADALVYAAGGQSKVKVVQDYFRVLTGAEGKTVGLIVDAADNHHDKLVESAAKRLAIYRQCFGVSVMKPSQLVTWVSSAVS